MASKTLKSLIFTFARRNVPKRGPSSADTFNDTFQELANDLAKIASEWNLKLKPILATIPYGDKDTTVDAYVNGLDGRTFWVDSSLTGAEDDLTFYNATYSRPSTVKEALYDIYDYVANQVAQVRLDIAGDTTGLTTVEKNAIGINIFDSSQTSSASSLDGKSENNRLNLIQIAKDLYGAGYTLDNDGNANLTNNSVYAMVDALLELHDGNWDDDTSLSHTGAFTATQANVDPSVSYDDSFVGVPADLEDDLNQIRTEIKTLKGTADWQTNHSALYGGGANSLEELLASTAGSASKSATNPWGYQYDDIDGLSAVLDAIRDFIGQGSHVDDYPLYSSNVYISDGDNLEIALGKLDAALDAVSGLVGGGTTAFTDLTDSPSNYTLAGQKIVVVNSGETGVEFSPVKIDVTGQLVVPKDIDIIDSGSGPVIRSPDSTRWRISVDNNGVLYTTQI